MILMPFGHLKSVLRALDGWLLLLAEQPTAEKVFRDHAVTGRWLLHAVLPSDTSTLTSLEDFSGARRLLDCGHRVAVAILFLRRQQLSGISLLFLRSDSGLRGVVLDVCELQLRHDNRHCYDFVRVTLLGLGLRRY